MYHCFNFVPYGIHWMFVLFLPSLIEGMRLFAFHQERQKISCSSCQSCLNLDCSYNSGGVACDNNIVGNIANYHTASTHNGTRSDFYTAHHRYV